MLSVLDYDGDFVFPETQELVTKLSDLLETNVEERYFLSDRFIKYACDLENRNGFIRGRRFRPHDEHSEIAYTITTNPGGRATDNFVILPAVGAIRGRPVNGKNEQRLEIKDEPITNTITTVQKDNVILVPQATKAGYAAAEVGDGIYTNRMKYKRGVVQKSMIPTLKTSVSDVGVVVNDKDDLINIRRLTPRECWRLMGWDDTRIDVAFSSGNSETQLYKQAGNSIVVNVLTSIFISMKNTFKL